MKVYRNRKINLIRNLYIFVCIFVYQNLIVYLSLIK
jgi:hypothetical protein